MEIKIKIAILSLLFPLVLSFSGCSIRKAEEETKNKAPETKKQEEAKNIDSDSDGLLNMEEEKLGTDKHRMDTDEDGLNDYDEIKKWKTDPLNPDTDGDNYLDGREAESGYNPAGLGQFDSDSDGLGDADEKRIGTDPNKFDTDSDGLSDKEEIDLERDPLVAGQ